MTRPAHEKNGFPVFASHADARCFACDGQLEDPIESGYPPAYGKWEGWCATCRKRTWYNLQEDTPCTDSKPS